MNVEAGTIGLTHFLTLAALLFVIGAVGVFRHRKSVIAMLIAIELMMLAVNINFVAFAAYGHNLVGQVFTMMVLTVAAAEIAVGLALLVLVFRNRGSISVDALCTLKERPDA